MRVQSDIGIIVTRDDPQLIDLKRDSTIKIESVVGKRTIVTDVPCFFENEHGITLPWNFPISGVTKPVSSSAKTSKNVVASEGIIEYEDNVLLNEEQRKIFKNIKGRNGALTLRAGGGKSYIAAKLISHYKEKTLIIVHMASLIPQWSAVVQECCGVVPGEYYAKKKTDGPVVIAIINSIAGDTFTVGKKKYTQKEYLSQFKFVIMDEAHLYVTKKKIMTLYNLSSIPKRLALTASYKDSALGAAHEWFLGPELVETEKVANTFDTKVIMMPYYASNEEYVQMSVNRFGDVAMAGTLSNILSDPDRLSFVARTICNIKGDVLVFADSREYLERLDVCLKTEYEVDVCLLDRVPEDEQKTNKKSNEQRALKESKSREIVDQKVRRIESSDESTVRGNALVYGGTNSKAVEEAVKSSRIILSTYAFFGTGISIPRMTSLVMATGRKSKLNQIIGRIQRLGGDDNKQRVVYDIVDMKNAVTRKQWAERCKYYKECGYDIDDSNKRSKKGAVVDEEEPPHKEVDEEDEPKKKSKSKKAAVAEADEEAPAPKKSRSKKASVVEDVAEEEEPKKKSKSKKTVDEEEPVVKKNKSKKTVDEEEPVVKKKSKKVVVEADEEEPVVKKKSKKVVVEADEEEPVVKKKSKKASE